ncbi:sigma-70 family RNA polymerase sigma factor [Cohnella algarum]|uniref:sigma-70 family RNA polymerase sigma factor n=1 Tax=Cohnella algarum TaxID=2044859 RepID=UPI001967BAAD|nr:sigma-70 family RNA polymerase sigma factor [Cohnella algarum]MBN2980150.1 sigma-70 family RNA polymerase sigma factor [Cohnella algarum]
MSERDFNPHLGHKDDVVKQHMRLVHAIAQKFRWAQAAHIDMDDLISEGSIGLLMAFDRYDGRAKFEAYAAPWIRGQILDFIQRRRTSVRVPRSVYRLIGKILRNHLEECKPSLIASRLSCSEVEAARALKCWRENCAVSFEQPVGIEDVTIGELIGQTQDMSDLTVKEFLSQLPAVERTFVQARIAGERKERPILLKLIQDKLATYLGLNESEVHSMSLELTQEKYIELKKRGMSDEVICKEYDLGSSTLGRMKKKWGVSAQRFRPEKKKTKPTPAKTMPAAVQPEDQEDWKAKYLELWAKKSSEFDLEQKVIRLEQENRLLKETLKFYL